ncbi:MAG: hypothetical protein EOP56_02625 [Sphingobacteriales bacterium]|nr:MAG: hypothetical protein EOP56_02625 [Sphingobacteriales bacterium]
MKSLDELMNVEKGRLLHQLFPLEIPAFLQFVALMSQTIEEEQQRIKSKWANGFIDFEYWLSLSRATAKKLTQYGKRLNTNSSLFADQLFDGHAALYLSHCLIQYTQPRKHENEKFTLAVQLLFT